MKIILLSFFIVVSSYSFDFDMLPTKFNPTNVKVTFESSQATGILIHYRTNTNLPTDTIINYYKSYLNAQWQICTENKITMYNRFFLDFQRNEYELKKVIEAINQNAKSILSFKVARKIKTNKIYVFIMQYDYINTQQFKQDSELLCK